LVDEDGAAEEDEGTFIVSTETTIITTVVVLPGNDVGRRMMCLNRSGFV
jgi:hypothetical protein